MGSILLVLHAHLPYVRHPENKRHLEETWYFEAAIESYMPLLDFLLRLPSVAPGARVALSVSPTLLEMMDDPLLTQRLYEHMEAMIQLSSAEVDRTAGDPDMNPLALMYLERFTLARETLRDKYGGNLLEPLRQLAAASHVELMTSSATHAFLPNLSPMPSAVRTQIRMGLGCYKRHFGAAPSGFWLPECGYYEGLDRILAEEGIRSTFLSSVGLLHASPRPSHGLYSPIKTPSGVLAFGRERKLSMLVWSTMSGYPSHPAYRDFYRDAGFDVNAPHMRRFVEGLVPGGHSFTGLKYHRITGESGPKEPYRPEEALMQADIDAEHFVQTLAGRSEEILSTAGFDPLFVLPFDAELFGHWWHEGPQWLELFLKKASDHPSLSMGLPSDHLSRAGECQETCPSLSSWGVGGYGKTWSDIKGQGEALAIMLSETAIVQRLAEIRGDRGGRAMQQALRELLLLQSSDWGFLSHKETAEDYAHQRMQEHASNLKSIISMLKLGNIEDMDKAKLAKMEARTPLFPDISWAGETDQAGD